jgi:hypothetical protein
MIPTNFEEAIIEMKSILTRNYTQPRPLRLPRTFGMSIRNKWNLWDNKSPLHSNLKNRFNIWHVDDMYGLILHVAENELDGKPGAVEERVAYYNRYWENTNNSWLDPEDHRLVP